MTQNIKIHTPAEFEKMREAGKVVAEVLDLITKDVKPGVTTEYLNDKCVEYTKALGATPAALGYKGFPKSVCVSVNHVVCHGIPDSRILEEGDILNIDAAVIMDGWYGDSGRMYWVGKKINPKAIKLTQITYECMMRGIEAVKPGARTSDIGKAIQDCAHAAGFSVVRDFCGHGLGEKFHSEPSVLHYYDPTYPDVVLQEGMFFTIEPMINVGGYGVKVLPDGWTAVTRDRSLSAQFEHSIAVTAEGYEIFTKSHSGLDCPPYDLSKLTAQ